MGRYGAGRALEQQHAFVCEHALFPRLFDHWHRVDDQGGTALYLQRDCKVDVVGVRDGAVQTLDEKVMDCFSTGRAVYAGNLIIETVSNVERYRETGEHRYRGWWYTSAADFIAYVSVTDHMRRATIRCYRLDDLRNLLTDTRLEKYPARTASTNDGLYHTEFRPVPARDLHGLVEGWEYEFTKVARAA